MFAMPIKERERYSRLISKEACHAFGEGLILSRIVSGGEGGAEVTG